MFENLKWYFIKKKYQIKEEEPIKVKEFNQDHLLEFPVKITVWKHFSEMTIGQHTYLDDVVIKLEKYYAKL